MVRAETEMAVGIETWHSRQSGSILPVSQLLFIGNYSRQGGSLIDMYNLVPSHRKKRSVPALRQ